jgi:1-acyl-sn-glycerol-3-phosphate acyltransferase
VSIAFYAFARALIADGSRLVYRARIHGRDKLPTTGGYVLAPSHRSMMDIPLAAVLTKRRLRYMGKASLFKIPVLGWFFRVLGGFEVQRDGTDRKALRDAIGMLQGGEILLVYPEGTRQRGAKIEPLQPGAAYLALRAGVPIVPVGMAGTEEILRDHPLPIPHFRRVDIVIGEPLIPPARDGHAVPRAQVDALTAQLHEAIQAVFDEAYDYYNA